MLVLRYLEYIAYTHPAVAQDLILDLRYMEYIAYTQPAIALDLMLVLRYMEYIVYTLLQLWTSCCCCY